MTIKVGDFVMIVKNNGHKCFDCEIGLSFVVEDLYADAFHCVDCFALFNNEALAGAGEQWVVPAAWLMKIDPPANMETIEHESTITA
jgi:hypothetical protein